MRTTGPLSLQVSLIAALLLLGSGALAAPGQEAGPASAVPGPLLLAQDWDEDAGGDGVEYVETDEEAEAEDVEPEEGAEPDDSEADAAEDDPWGVKAAGQSVRTYNTGPSYFGGSGFFGGRRMIKFVLMALGAVLLVGVGWLVNKFWGRK